MQTFFIFTLVIWALFAINSIFIQKRPIGLNLIVATGIYFPLGLYCLAWSLYIDRSISDDFYYIFFCLNIGLILYNLFVEDGIAFNKNIMPKMVSKPFIFVVDVCYVMLFLLESYIGSGSIAPALSGIDIHTYSAPLIAFVTRSLYIFVLINVIAFLSTKKRAFLFVAIALIALPVVTRNMRITAIVTLLQLMFFVCSYLFATKSPDQKRICHSSFSKKKKSRKITVLAIVVAVVLFVAGAATMTNDRMSHYGKYDLKYSNEIAYTGPDFMSDVISVYYGYFPMSFNNLNLSLKYGQSEHNYLGLYSYKSVYYGVLQWDNIFDLNPAEPDSPQYRVTSSTSATVATAFWDYWYDYGYACFIPIFFMLAICGLLTSKMRKDPSLFATSQYCYFIPLVFFESFQNVFFGSETLVEVIIAMVLFNFAFRDASATRPIRNINSLSSKKDSKSVH